MINLISCAVLIPKEDIEKKHYAIEHPGVLMDSRRGRPGKQGAYCKCHKKNHAAIVATVVIQIESQLAIIFSFDILKSESGDFSLPHLAGRFPEALEV